MKKLLYILFIMVSLTFPLFANSVAKITAITGEVSVFNQEGTVGASLGQNLYIDDSVITANMSKAQLIFKDETIITIGKNSNFSVKEYVYDEEQEEPVAKFELLKGAMRTITGFIGKIAPEKFSVKTKTATIGIRGTNFTVVVGQSGVQQVYCTYGAVSVTVQNEQKVVPKGFYVSISPSGETKVKPFSPKELQSIQDENFAEESSQEESETQESSEQKSTSQESGESQESTQEQDSSGTQNESAEEDSSTTSQTEDSLASSDLQSTGVSDTSSNQESTTTDNISEATQDSTDAQKTTDIQQQAQTTVTTLEGWGANNKNYENLATINMSINQSESVFSSSSLIDSASSTEDWTYTIATAPTSFISDKEFSTTFTSATSTDSSKSDFTLGTTNYLKTVSDLSVDDEMTWGEWALDIEYKQSLGTAAAYDQPVSATRSVQGFWIAGELTPDSVIANYAQSTASYSGKYMAYDFTTTSSSVISASASLYVDFSQDTATLNINTSDDTQIWRSYDMSGANTNHISGSSTAGGVADGNFYGATGSSVGGNFTVLNGTTTQAKGVYQVSTTDTLK